MSMVTIINGGGKLLLKKQASTTVWNASRVSAPSSLLENFPEKSISKCWCKNESLHGHQFN